MHISTFRIYAKVGETISKMFKFKLLTIILVVVQGLCSAITFPTIFLKYDESYESHKSRMNSKGLPCIGESYQEYKTNLELSGRKNELISEREYQIFMESIPRINESFASINDRNIQTMDENPHINGLQLYEEYEFNGFLIYRYPQLHESYNEYKLRVENHGAEAFSYSTFKSLKNVFPNIGEKYSKYKQRLEKLGLQGFNKNEYQSFFNFIPRSGESNEEFFKRYYRNYMRNTFNKTINRWSIIKSEEVDGLRFLFPQIQESYGTYKNRITAIDLVPMSEDAFKLSLFLIDILEPRFT